MNRFFPDCTNSLFVYTHKFVCYCLVDYFRFVEKPVRCINYYTMNCVLIIRDTLIICTYRCNFCNLIHSCTVSAWIFLFYGILTHPNRHHHLLATMRTRFTDVCFCDFLALGGGVYSRPMANFRYFPFVSETVGESVIRIDCDTFQLSIWKGNSRHDSVCKILYFCILLLNVKCLHAYLQVI